MVICRKPFTIFDVDLAGAGLLLALIAGGWWFVVRPWSTLWTDYRTMAQHRAVAQDNLQNDLNELERFKTGLASLRETVTNEAQTAPSAESVSSALKELTELAKREQLTLLSVTPQPVANSGDYVCADIRIVGRGQSRDFVHFLDRFADVNPYQSLESCVISRDHRNTKPECELSWQTRLYLIPDIPSDEPTEAAP